MKRRSPPWGAIEAFIVAARTGSFKEAAGQLGLSPPAFSRRIQALEHHVGAKLFDRAGPVPTLTPVGAQYLERLLPGYEAIRAATDWMAPEARQRPVRVGISQSLAISWLVPRLPRFYEQVHDLHLVLRTGNSPADLMGGGVDIGILFGDGGWEGLAAEKLFGFDAVVLSAPRLADGRPPPSRVQDLKDHRLLQLSHPPDQWERWLALAGYCGAAPTARDRFDSNQVMFEAAARGVGIALGARPLAEPFLAAGRLRVAFDLALPIPGGYHVAATPELRRQPAVRSVWQWLTAEAARPVAPGAIALAPFAFAASTG